MNTKSEWHQPSLWRVRSELNKEWKDSNTEPILVSFVCFSISSESIYFSFKSRNVKLMCHLIMNMLSSDQAKLAKHCLQQYNETNNSYFLFHSQCKCYQKVGKSIIFKHIHPSLYWALIQFWHCVLTPFLAANGTVIWENCIG